MRPGMLRGPRCVLAGALLAIVGTGAAYAEPMPATSYAKVYAVTPSAPASDFNPMGGFGLFATKAVSYDKSSASKSAWSEVSADAAVYAGGGVEPMAFTQIDARGANVNATSYAQAEVLWLHWVEALQGAPQVDYVPGILDFRVGQEESNGYAYAQLIVKTCWTGYIGCANPSRAMTWEAREGAEISKRWNSLSNRYEVVDYDDEFSLPVQMVPGSAEVIYIKAKSTYELKAGSVTASSAQSIIDPLLSVDPDWEYAKYFRVVQQAGLADPSTRVEVTRDWLPQSVPDDPSAVPEPSQTALLLVGLALLLGTARRRADRASASGRA